MREILFRGKDVNGTHEWRTGYFCTLVQGSLKVIGNGVDWCQVYSETVGQYTGLCDKNGTRIFEGDIIRDADGDVMIVKWLTEGATFVLEPKPYVSVHFYSTLPSEIEVIGNVHDNPNLIKA